MKIKYDKNNAPMLENLPKEFFRNENPREGRIARRMLNSSRIQTVNHLLNDSSAISGFLIESDKHLIEQLTGRTVEMSVDAGEQFYKTV